MEGGVLEGGLGHLGHGQGPDRSDWHDWAGTWVARWKCGWVALFAWYGKGEKVPYVLICPQGTVL